MMVARTVKAIVARGAFDSGQRHRAIRARRHKLGQVDAEFARALPHRRRRARLLLWGRGGDIGNGPGGRGWIWSASAQVANDGAGISMRAILELHERGRATNPG